MMVLGIETATDVCAAAVVDQGRVLAEETIVEGQVHAERLLEAIDGVLRRSAVPLAALNAIAVSIGPGSFTGLRIGLSVAKGLGYATGVPLVAVPTLVALARRIAETPGGGGAEFILAALDARRDEVYCQLFERHAQTMRSVWDAEDLAVPEVLRRLDGMTVLIGGTAADKIMRGAEQLTQGGGHLAALGKTEGRCSAVTVAQVGYELYASGETADPASLEPRYIKDFFLKTPQQ